MFRDRIIITFAKPSGEPLEIKLYAIAGTLVFEENCGRPVSTRILQGEKIRGLNRGVYFLKVTSGKDKIAGIKLIKF
jgi:hypothetical protein